MKRLTIHLTQVNGKKAGIRTFTKSFWAINNKKMISKVLKPDDFQQEFLFQHP